MYSIDEDNNITLTRGDSFYATVSIKDKDTGEEYIPVEGDKVRFALKRRYGDKQPLILKDIPIDTLLLYIEPVDTKPLSFDDYCYDIELTTSEGDVDTFIWEKRFTIAKEVY